MTYVLLSYPRILLEPSANVTACSSNVTVCPDVCFVFYLQLSPRRALRWSSANPDAVADDAVGPSSRASAPMLMLTLTLTLMLIRVLMLMPLLVLLLLMLLLMLLIQMLIQMLMLMLMLPLLLLIWVLIPRVPVVSNGGSACVSSTYLYYGGAGAHAMLTATVMLVVGLSLIV
jgi:hypothetical protein